MWHELGSLAPHTGWGAECSLSCLALLQDEQQRPAVPDLGGLAAGDASSSSSGRQANIKCARSYSLVHYG